MASEHKPHYAEDLEGLLSAGVILNPYYDFVSHRSTGKTTSSPQKEVGPKVQARLRGVFPPVDLPNLHKEYLKWR